MRKKTMESILLKFLYLRIYKFLSSFYLISLSFSLVSYFFVTKTKKLMGFLSGNSPPFLNAHLSNPLPKGHKGFGSYYTPNSLELY